MAGAPVTPTFGAVTSNHLLPRHAASPVERFVAYYRVSTQQQRKSGLGLEAQQKLVRDYLRARAGEAIAEFTEIESGRNSARGELAKALWRCRVFGATLLIARLDRLARSVTLIASLLESEVRFVVADMPLANRFTLHILAAVAEYESKLKSERLKGAYAIARAKGRKFGNSRRFTREDTQKGLAGSKHRRQQKATAFARDILPELRRLKAEGESCNGIARRLTEMGIVSPGGGDKWNSRTVEEMFRRLAEPAPRPHIRRRTAKRLSS